MYLIVNLKVNISTITFQVKVMIGVEVKLIVISCMNGVKLIVVSINEIVVSNNK